MPQQLYSGTLQEFAGSMAAEMEEAYDAVLKAAGKDPLPASGRDDLRMLLIAIARGVINHLEEKREAFSITVSGPLPQTVHPAVSVRSPSD